VSIMQQHTPKAWDAFCILADETLSDGALSAKVKELMALALSIVVHGRDARAPGLRTAEPLLRHYTNTHTTSVPQ
jgi:alkylhydroperoxidase/carboxymuconolactone decarboxylase family protein YurZ